MSRARPGRPRPQVLWLLPDARCPNCNAVPAFRLPEEEREAARGQEPTRPKASVQCQVSWCRTHYVLTARDFARAS